MEFALEHTQVYAVAGAASLALGLTLLWYYWHSKALLDEMWSVDTYTARELRRLCSGGFSAIVEVEGKVTCDNPITSPAMQVECCSCRTTVERRVRNVRGTESGFQPQYTWVKDYDRTQAAVFKVHDETGYTLVSPIDADICAEGPFKQITASRLPWFEGVGCSDTGEYLIKEWVFVPTGYVYVLGQATACEDSGTSPDVLIHSPVGGYMNPKRKFFIISRKSEKQLTQHNEISLKICFWGGVLGLLTAAYCALNLLGVVP